VYYSATHGSYASLGLHMSGNIWALKCRLRVATNHQKINPQWIKLVGDRIPSWRKYIAYECSPQCGLNGTWGRVGQGRPSQVPKCPASRLRLLTIRIGAHMGKSSLGQSLCPSPFFASDPMMIRSRQFLCTPSRFVLIIISCYLRNY
jgi:hypothetical protein